MVGTDVGPKDSSEVGCISVANEGAGEGFPVGPSTLGLVTEGADVGAIVGVCDGTAVGAFVLPSHTSESSFAIFLSAVSSAGEGVGAARVGPNSAWISLSSFVPGSKLKLALTAYFPCGPK